MGDSIKAYYDDVDKYEYLCEKYGEKVQLDERGSIDCYGPHSSQLRKRQAAEDEVERQKRLAALPPVKKFRIFFTQVNQQSFEAEARTLEQAIHIARNKWRKENNFPVCNGTEIIG